MNLIKRDVCIWFKHLSPEMRALLSGVGESGQITLWLNGVETVWVRMRNGAGRPTPGMRIVQGTEMWRAIPLSAEFSLAPRGSAAVTPRRVESAEAQTPFAPKFVAAPGVRTLFGEYIFADYSGAARLHNQRKAIVVASATPDSAVIYIEVSHAKHW